MDKLPRLKFMALSNDVSPKGSPRGSDSPRVKLMEDKITNLMERMVRLEKENTALRLLVASTQQNVQSVADLSVSNSEMIQILSDTLEANVNKKIN